MSGSLQSYIVSSKIRRNSIFLRFLAIVITIKNKTCLVVVSSRVETGMGMEQKSKIILNFHSNFNLHYFSVQLIV